MQEVFNRDCDTSSCHLNAVTFKCRRTVGAEWANVSGGGLVTAMLHVMLVPRCSQPLLVCTSGTPANPLQNSKFQHQLFPDVASAVNQPCVSPRHARTWTGRRCCRGKCPRPSSRPSAARKTSVTLTRSSPLKCPRSLRRGSLASSAAGTRKASGTLTTSRTSAEAPKWGDSGRSSMSRMFLLDSVATVVNEEGKPSPLTHLLIVCVPIITL